MLNQSYFRSADWFTLCNGWLSVVNKQWFIFGKRFLLERWTIPLFLYSADHWKAECPENKAQKWFLVGLSYIMQQLGQY